MTEKHFPPVDPGTGGVRILDTGDLQQRARSFVRALVALDGPDAAEKIDMLRRIGQAEIAAVTASLKQPARMDASSGDARIAAQLDRLRTIVADLDPAPKPPIGLWQRMFGANEAGSAARGYFDRYEQAQDAIADVLQRLAEGRDDLTRANISIATQRKRLDDAIDRLDRPTALAALLDARIDAATREIVSSDPARATSLRTGALIAVRERAQDLAVQQTIATQGRLALEIVVQNNLALIAGIDRASSATVAALRVAITAAEAIAHQRIVLDRIAKVDAIAADAATDPDAQHAALQAAFGEVHGSLDALDDVRARALRRRAIPGA